ncbi:MAG: hypothetical protein U9Q70_09645 [Chloroflexota bacterium]|nr:hypothetical protein [Chloroflexota bacterium]
MKSFFRVIRVLLVVLMIVPVGFPTSISSQTLTAEPVSKPAAGESVALSVGPYRARVHFPNTTARARLDQLGVVVLEEGDDWALVLADGEQLETLARLRFAPEAADAVDAWGEESSSMASPLAGIIETMVAQATVAERADRGIVQVQTAAQADLRAAMHALTSEQQAGIASLTSVDDDADGLTNTQEQWWCTDPLNPDSDGDGMSDGDEVQAAKDWLANETSGPPAYGKPFVGWPPDHTGCYDDDQDSIPDLAERWELGLNMNRESTDRDKFDDGQELFGNTYCPGSGGFCGYGALPRNEDWGVIFAEMPAWVKAPGNHPLVAAFPVPEIDVVESSLHMEAVTIVTTDHTISEGTEKSYSTAKTEGTSTSVADTETWNNWQETAITQYQYSGTSLNVSNSQRPLGWFDNFLKGEVEFDATMQNCGAAAGSVGLVSGSAAGCANIKVGEASIFRDLNLFKDFEINVPEIKLPDFDVSNWFNNISVLDNLNFSPSFCLTNCGQDALPVTPEHQPVQMVQSAESQDRTSFANRSQYIFHNSPLGNAGNRLVYREYYPVQYSLPVPRATESTSSGHSVGGARTTTNTQYEEHTVTNGEAFSSSESWSTATAVDSAHAADLWFTYQVRNTGTEYAREIGDLAFNIYLGDDPNPAYTYFVAPDVGGDGKFHNFMPGEEHSYTSQHIPLTLQQMAAVDLGGPVRIVVEDYTYGIDELFYEDAINAGVLVAMEDGTGDGDEAIDTYLIPTWGEETVLDILARYFPHTTDAYGNLIAVWTPETRADTPAWCDQPNHVGATLWCRHALSTADWWNVYLNGLGDGTEGFQDTPCRSCLRGPLSL